MRKCTVIAALAASLCALHAGATLVTLNLDPASGGVNVGTLAVNGNGFSGSGQTNISGSVLADVGFAADGVTPQSIQLLNGTDLGFSDVAIGPGGALGGTTGARGTATSGVLPFGAGGTVNAGGAQLIADEGTLRLGIDTRDLAANNLTFTLDNTSILTFTSNQAGDVINFTVTGSISGAAVEGSMTYTATAAQVAATGSITVPEPTMILAAPVGLLLLRRRR